MYTSKKILNLANAKKFISGLSILVGCLQLGACEGQATITQSSNVGGTASSLSAKSAAQKIKDDLDKANKKITDAAKKLAPPSPSQLKKAFDDGNPLEADPLFNSLSELFGSGKSSSYDHMPVAFGSRFLDVQRTLGAKKSIRGCVYDLFACPDTQKPVDTDDDTPMSFWVAKDIYSYVNFNPAAPKLSTDRPSDFSISDQKAVTNFLCLIPAAKGLPAKSTLKIVSLAFTDLQDSLNEGARELAAADAVAARSINDEIADKKMWLYQYQLTVAMIRDQGCTAVMQDYPDWRRAYDSMSAALAWEAAQKDALSKLSK